MVEAGEQQRWAPFAMLTSTLINVNKPKGSKPTKPQQLNPYHKQERSDVPLQTANIDILKVFDRK